MSTPIEHADREQLLAMQRSPMLGPAAQERIAARLQALSAPPSMEAATGFRRVLRALRQQAEGTFVDPLAGIRGADKVQVSGSEPKRKPKPPPATIDDELNQTERDFLDQVLEPRLASGVSQRLIVQRLVLRIAPGLSYRPEAVELHPGGFWWIWETKGAHSWEDSLVKFKAGAEAFPWARWTMVRRVRRGHPWELVYDRGAVRPDMPLPDAIQKKGGV